MRYLGRTETILTCTQILPNKISQSNGVAWYVKNNPSSVSIGIRLVPQTKILLAQKSNVTQKKCYEMTGMIFGSI